MVKKIVIKLFFATFPLYLVLGLYFYEDPYKVLYTYENYYPYDGVRAVVINRDFANVEVFLKNYKKYNYDSYIFGNSRSRNYLINDWKPHIVSNNCFHFDADNEGIYGIERKINLIHSKGVPIRNALIILDNATCKDKTQLEKVLILRKHPLLSNSSKLVFQLYCIHVFLDLAFLKHYLFYLATGKISEEAVKQFILNDIPCHYELPTNELTLQGHEQMIARNIDSFYATRGNTFYPRDTIIRYAPRIIGAYQKNLFLNVKKIFTEDNTNYRLVINPLYDQIRFDTTDLKYLKQTFGADKVFDFSGRDEMTEDIHNYYERSHYRPCLARKILDSIYKHKP